MAAGRTFVVAGLARPRSAWFADVGEWAGASVIPVTFLRCVSAAELRRRLAGEADGDGIDAVIVETGVDGVDPDLRAMAARTGTLVIEVGGSSDTPRPPRSPRLAARFTADELVAVLRAHLGDERWAGAARTDRGVGATTGVAGAAGAAGALADGADPAATRRSGASTGERPEPAGPRAPLVAVLGPGGCGASTVAIAVAQGLAARPTTQRRFVLRDAGPAPHLAEQNGEWSARTGVVLADLVVPGSLAMYHDAGDVVPGVPELVEACRAGADDPVRRVLFGIDRRGYSVLLGCRSQRDRQLVDAAAMDLVLDRLRQDAGVVVADTDALLAGDGPAPGRTLWDRLAIGRAVVRAADVVLLCATGELRAIHAMLRIEQSLVEAGVPGTRIVRVVNRSARRGGAGTAVARDLAALSGRSAGATVLVPRHPGVERCHVTGDPLPRAVVRPLVDAVTDALDRG